LGLVRGRWLRALARFFLRLREDLAAAFWRFVPKYFNCFALNFRAILFLFLAGFAILVSTVAIATLHPRAAYALALQGRRTVTTYVPPVPVFDT
jgi:hypothetical protein